MVGAGAVRSIGMRALVRAAVAGAFALVAAGCGSVVNMMPDPRDFHLPDSKTFAPTSMSAYARPVTAKDPVGPADLVDANGNCPGAAPRMSNDAPPDVAPPALSGSVALEMTECQVAQALGPAQQTQIGGSPGMRVVDITYIGGERGGIYHFVDGRLATVDRGPEPLPPPPQPVAKKPPAKKPKPAPPPPA